ncbi:MAG: DUF4189 domain-containing protein [Beijerinckiaceae bacterium]
MFKLSMSRHSLCALTLLAGFAAWSAPATAQTQWGAMAYNDRGATGFVWGRGSEEQAQADALKLCRENATVPCRVISGADRACIAASLGNGGPNSQKGYAEVRVGLISARNAALVACVSKSHNKCEIRNFMCADGSHKQN